MASPEHIFQLRVLYAPDTCSGGGPNGPAELKNPQQSFASDFSESATRNIQSEQGLGCLFETDLLPVIAVGESDAQVGSYVLGKDDFIWTEDLSENGQKLWQWILNSSSMEFLEWIAAEEGWDLKAAMEELGSHGLLEESSPGYYRIIRKKL